MSHSIGVHSKEFVSAQNNFQHRLRVVRASFQSKTNCNVGRKGKQALKQKAGARLKQKFVRRLKKMTYISISINFSAHSEWKDIILSRN